MKFCDVADAIEETGACDDKVDCKASRLYLEDQLEKVTKYFDPREARIIKEKASGFDEYYLINQNTIMVDKTLSTLDEKEREMKKNNQIVETIQEKFANFNKEITELLQNNSSSFDQKQPKSKSKQPHDQPQRHFGGIEAETKQSKIPKSPTRRQLNNIDRQLNIYPNYDPQKLTGSRSSEFRGAQTINPKFEVHGQTLSSNKSPRSYDKQPFFITQGVTPRSLDNLSRYLDTHLDDGHNLHPDVLKMPEEDQETKRQNKSKLIPIGGAKKSDQSYSPEPWDTTEMRRSKFGKQQWTSHH